MISALAKSMKKAPTSGTTRKARGAGPKRVTLVQSAAGVVGPSLVGGWFDVADSRRALFLLLTVFLAGAFALLATLARGFGEASGHGAEDGAASKGAVA